MTGLDELIHAGWQLDGLLSLHIYRGETLDHAEVVNALHDWRQSILNLNRSVKE